MKKLLTLPLLILIFQASAQDAIVTDRPTQSAASAVVPAGSAIIEYGFIYESASSDVTNLTIGNFLARVGIANGFEFRITQNVLRSEFPGVLGDESVSGLSPTTLGAKIHLAGEQGAFPQMSIIGQVTLENGEQAFRPNRPTPEVRLNFSNSLSEFVSLGYNVGMSFAEDDRQTLYTMVLGYSFLPGWTAFAEPYGFFGDGYSDHRFNTGLIYLVKDNFQLDLTGGFGLSDVSPDYFIGFGAALGI